MNSDRRCERTECKEALLQETRVLLTDAYVLMGEDPERLLLAREVWQRKYEKLISFLVLVAAFSLNGWGKAW